MDLSNKFIKNKDIAYRNIESEILAVNPKDSLIYVFNSVGSRVWELLDGRLTVGEITSIIDSEFQGDTSNLQDDIIDFIEELRDKSLIST